MTTPLSMIIVGSMLSDLSIKSIIKEKLMYYLAFIKLIIIPVCIYIIITILHGSELLKTICILLEATPSAVVCSAFPDEYNIKKELSAKIIFITTAFSIVTIPLIMSIF